jgi:hypothetical protein
MRRNQWHKATPATKTRAALVLMFVDEDGAPAAAIDVHDWNDKS